MDLATFLDKCIIKAFALQKMSKEIPTTQTLMYLNRLTHFKKVEMCHFYY